MKTGSGANIVLLFLTGSLLLVTDIDAQSSGRADVPDSCELISAKIDAVGSKFPSLAGKDSKLIILASSPTGTNDRYAKTRIKTTLAYLKKFYGIESERVVYGIGEPTKSLSFLRFYINGVLFIEIRMSAKGRLCTGMGDPLRFD
jgi:hypothetical protein